jgi:hypothetical protein
VRGGATAPKTETPPSGLGLGVLPDTPLELTAIVLLDRRDDADEPTARTLTTVEAVAALTAHTSFLSHLARPLQFVAAILAETPVVRLTYREARDLEAIDAFWQTSGGHKAAIPARGTVDTATDAADSPPAGRLRRAAVADAIAPGDADQLLVLHDDVVHTLDGIAPTLWRALGAGGDGPGLVTALVAAHGHPPEGDAEQLVGAALDELGAAGLVVEVGSGWRVAADCAWQESVGGGVVVLPLRRVRTASPLVLDEVGSLIWRAVAGAPGAGVPQISRIVERELLDAPDDLADHVAEFIASLERALLVDRV